MDEDQQKAGAFEVYMPPEWTRGSWADAQNHFAPIKLIEDWGLGYKLGTALDCIIKSTPEDLAEDKQIVLLVRAQEMLKRACDVPSEKAVRTMTFRKFNVNDAIYVWGLSESRGPLTGNLGRLGLAVGAISGGDPFEAMDHLNVYMLKFGTQEKEKQDADDDGNGDNQN